MKSSVTRRSLLKASLSVCPGLIFLLRPGSNGGAPTDPSAAGQSAKLKPGQITVSESAEEVTFANGVVSVVYDEQSGLASFSWNGARKITGAFSSADLNGIVKTTSLPRHRYAGNPTKLNDKLGKGRRFTIVSSADHQLQIL